ncbi:PsbP-related protein [Calothrix sp. CCY 0018]|uniref:PsbP-related protein n=1 Tax=Calothrix sp. CCY 0018 TaxID=3103864 RepID=UPI0039C6BD73
MHHTYSYFYCLFPIPYCLQIIYKPKCCAKIYIYNPPKIVTYKESNLGITIKYPQSWQRQDIGNIFTKELVKFLSLLGKQDNFEEKVVLSIEDYPGSLEQSKDDFTKEINKALSAAEIIETTPITLGFKPAFKIIYTGKDEEKNLNLKNLQIWTLKANKAYIITYTAEQKDYDKFLPELKNMIKTFEISEQ